MIKVIAKIVSEFICGGMKVKAVFEYATAHYEFSVFGATGIGATIKGDIKQVHDTLKEFEFAVKEIRKQLERAPAYDIALEHTQRELEQRDITARSSISDELLRATAAKFKLGGAHSVLLGSGS